MTDQEFHESLGRKQFAIEIMSDKEFYEALGRKQFALDAMHVEYDKLLSLLAKVVAGEVTPNTVVVDLAGRSWKTVSAFDQAFPIVDDLKGQDATIIGTLRTGDVRLKEVPLTG